FTAAPMSARRAYELGLVNRVVPAHELDTAIDQLCEAILAMSPKVLGLGKAAFYALRSGSEEAAYRGAVDVMTATALLPDAQEGIAAFLQKRAPCWSDRAPDRCR